MERNGLRGGQITEIRGYADTSLRVKDKPLDPRNRRVSVIVQHAWKEADLPEKLRTAATTATTEEAGSKTGSDRKPVATPSASH
jgi:chemotaxis protein MotB